MADGTLDRLLTTLAVRIHAFAVCEIEAGWRLEFAPMDAIIVHYVLRGGGTLRSAGREVAFAPGTIIVVPAGHGQDLGTTEAPRGTAEAANHCGLHDDAMVRFRAGEGGSDILVACATLSASYGGALGLFASLMVPLPEDVSGDAAFGSLFCAMLREVSAPALGTQALVEAVMKQCLILLLRRHMLRDAATSPLLAALRDERLGRAVLAIVQQPAALHTVESLAGLAGMSRSTFAGRFSSAYGLGPIEFAQRVRLGRAAELLRSTALPVKVIADSVGYSSRSRFTRTFRSVHGIDPTSYRERSARDRANLALASEPSVADQARTALRRLSSLARSGAAGPEPEPQ